MITPLSLLSPGSAAFAAVIWAFLIGFALGFLSCGIVFWRRLSRPGTEHWLRLRLDDAMAQIGGLLEQTDRLARLYAEAQRGRG